MYSLRKVTTESTFCLSLALALALSLSSLVLFLSSLTHLSSLVLFLSSLTHLSSLSLFYLNDTVALGRTHDLETSRHLLQALPNFIFYYAVSDFVVHVHTQVSITYLYVCMYVCIYMLRPN